MGYVIAPYRLLSLGALPLPKRRIFIYFFVGCWDLIDTAPLLIPASPKRFEGPMERIWKLAEMILGHASAHQVMTLFADSVTM